MYDRVDIYTDCACSGNPGPGGWAAILICRGVEKVLSGFVPETTNNRMELMGIIYGLQALKRPCDVTVYTDSSYVFNAFEKNWVARWINNCWLTADKKKIKNQDLWEELLEQTEYHDIKWVKVKGHANNEYNNRCDMLARNEIKENKFVTIERYDPFYESIKEETERENKTLAKDSGE